VYFLLGIEKGNIALCPLYCIIMGKLRSGHSPAALAAATVLGSADSKHSIIFVLEIFEPPKEGKLVLKC